MGTSTLDLIIADDHPVFRAGMLSIVRSALGDVRLREAGSASALKRELATAPADLLVLDVFFPGLEPESDLKEIRAAYPLMAVLVVSMLTERGAVERLMRAGANGFVSKRSPPEFMLKGIREVMEGERPVYLPAAGPGRPGLSCCRGRLSALLVPVHRFPLSWLLAAKWFRLFRLVRCGIFRLVRFAEAVFFRIAAKFSAYKFLLYKFSTGYSTCTCRRKIFPSTRC